MSPNHHRYANVLPIARLILVVAVVFCVSSACIYFVLKSALDNGSQPGWWWMSSFGAGFSCHGALLRVD